MVIMMMMVLERLMCGCCCGGYHAGRIEVHLPRLSTDRWMGGFFFFIYY